MRQLFLYGGYADNFEATTAPFIRASGGAGARIALLFPGPEKVERYLGYYREHWGAMGVTEIVPVVPGPAAVTALSECTGVFMCGGDTRMYHQGYAAGDARQVIRRRYMAGVPYAGLSAGALLATATSSVWGDRLTTGENVRFLRGSEEGCEAELEIREGLGLLANFMVEAHFSEQGGFTRLVTALEVAGLSRGLGMDDPICLQVIDETQLNVLGRGLAFVVRRTGRGRAEVQVLEPGETADLGAVK